MNVNGTIKLFLNENVSKDGSKRVRYSTTVSHKDEDGRFHNLYLDVRFAKAFEENLKKLQLSKYYDLKIEEGWLDVSFWANANNEEQTKLVVFVNKATITKVYDLGNAPAKSTKKAPKVTKQVVTVDDNPDLPF